MKKTLLTLIAAAVSLGAAAQFQLDNPGFEGDWKNIEPYTGGDTKVVGTTPEGWCVANVAGYKFIWWFGTTEVGSRVTGYGGGYACKLENTETAGNVIPGYVTLGTAWNTADTSGGSSDGGSFGGRKFTGRPDAMEFWYQRSARDNSQPASVVAYMWTGKTTQVNVPCGIGGNPARVEMENRDRNVLGMDYAYGSTPTMSQDFKLVASLMTEGEHAVKLAETKTDWTQAVLEFTYHDEEARPEQINVVFSAADYFTDRTNHKAGNTLTVDAVRFIYRSELAEATYDGMELSFDGGAASVDAPYELEKLSLRSNGQGASIRTAYDEETALLTVTVSGDNISEDADNYHIYTIQFAQPVVHSARLSDLRVGGETVESFDPDVASYAYAGFYEEGIVEAMAEDETAETAFSYDPETGLLTITVRAGEEERTYTVQFNLHAHSTRLSDLRIGGETVEGFDPDVAAYTYAGLYEDGIAEADVEDMEDAEAMLSYDPETGLLTITVSGEGGEAVYTVQFDLPAVADPYDLNTDGTVDVADVTLLVEYILNSTADELELRYDLNADGTVDVADVTLLVEYILNN
ncbi:MAG: dockerin type I repeat-containing protein [Alloprevotella sp.]|nr:dockerin type I repeat-containing protein [Alloprevotella sp.]